MTGLFSLVALLQRTETRLRLAALGDPMEDKEDRKPEHAKNEHHHTDAKRILGAENVELEKLDNCDRAG